MYLPYLYWDSSMLILIPGIILMLFAQWRVRREYSRLFTGAFAQRRERTAGSAAHAWTMRAFTTLPSNTYAGR